MRVAVPARSVGPFASVAAIIAKGAPPEWLASGLEHFSGFVGAAQTTSDERKRFEKILGEMHDAADLLIKWLPAFKALPVGPDDVAIALDVLPRIKDRLARAALRASRKGGKDPNVHRQVCAAVVVEAWRHIHGKPEPHSPRLWEACNEYWRACGGEYRGADVDTWRRDAEHAAIGNHVWIRKILSALAVRN
jgi:hypothetical protein